MDWDKLQRFQERTKGIRRMADGPPASSRLQPYAEELVYLRNQGYSHGLIRKFLKEECGIDITRGAISSFLSARGVKVSRS